MLITQVLQVHQKLKKLAAQPSFKQFKFFHENLVAVELAKVELTLNRPIFVGFAILDLSKTLMYDFHYNYIKQNYPDSTLLFIDTDSLTYQIQTDNEYEDSMLISICLIFLGTRKKLYSTMMKTESNRENEGCAEQGNC